MVMLAATVLIVGATLLALSRSQRLAPWFLGAGLALLGGFWVMNRLRIPWPNIHPLILPLNPYFLVTLAFVLIVAGAVGVAVWLLRRWFGWFGGDA